MKENLKGLTRPALEEKMASLGHSPYRGRQLFQWIYQKRETDFHKMTNLAKEFRRELDERFYLPRITVESRKVSADGTVKYLVGLEDSERIESVYIPMTDRNTLCVSTQVGCRMGCRFCATGHQKFRRNLLCWEIVDQLLSIDTPEPVTNVVVMGMGEPLDNYEEVVKALGILQDPLGPQIGKRHITISTVGLTPKIRELADADLGKVAISLHGTTDGQRRSIIPVSRRYPMNELLDTCRSIDLKGRSRFTFEYLLIRDINDSDEDAERLAKLLQGIPSKINLLAYNENSFADFRRPDEERIQKFQSLLADKGYTVTYRRSRGADIAGACGQLWTESTQES